MSSFEEAIRTATEVLGGPSHVRRAIQAAIDAGHLIEADKLVVVGYALVDRVAVAAGTHPRRVVAIQSLEWWGDSDSEHEKVYRLKKKTTNT